MESSRFIQLNSQRCPHCKNDTLSVKQYANDKQAFECSHCGARGPMSSVNEIPELMVSTFNYNLLKAVIDESPNLVFIKDLLGNFLLANNALANLYGTTPEQIIGKTDADFNSNAEQVESYLKNGRDVFQSGKTQILTETSTNAETGEVRYYQSVKKPIVGPDGDPLLLGIAHDITELQHAHQAVEEREKRYNVAMAASDVGLWDWDIRTNKVRHNLKWCELVGLQSDMLVHDMAALANIVHPDAQQRMMNAINHALKVDGVYESEHRLVRTDGQAIWANDRGRVVEYDEQGQPIRMVGSISDVTLRKNFENQLETATKELERHNETLEHLVQERTDALEQAVKELEKLATKDQLTGLGNRLMLKQWLAMQSRKQALVSILIDLDRFKSINDRFGHQVGDEVLVATSRCLSHIRENDLLVRWGGEEFLIILTDISIEQAYVIAENLRIGLQNANILPVNEQITASFGICGQAFNKSAYEEAIQQSDTALYQAKKAGRNQVKVYAC